MVRHTFEEVKLFVENKDGILLSETYLNIKTPLDIKCNKCNHVWHPTFGCIIDKRKGTWCPNCAGNLPLNKDVVVDRLAKKDIILVSNFISVSINIDVKCVKCNHQWSARPKDLFKAKDPTGCPICNGGVRLSYDKVKLDIESKNGKLITTYYENAHQKLDVECFEV